MSSHASRWPTVPLVSETIGGAQGASDGTGLSFATIFDESGTACSWPAAKRVALGASPTDRCWIVQPGSLAAHSELQPRVQRMPSVSSCPLMYSKAVSPQRGHARQSCLPVPSHSRQVSPSASTPAAQSGQVLMLARPGGVGASVLGEVMGLSSFLLPAFEYGPSR